MNQTTEDFERVKALYLQNELMGLRTILAYIYDGEQEAFNILYFVKANYKEWDLMIKYMKDNNLRGKKLVELFQNESMDGGGYHMGATYILSRVRGHKNSVEMVKFDQLKGSTK